MGEEGEEKKRLKRIKITGGGGAKNLAKLKVLKKKMVTPMI